MLSVTDALSVTDRVVSVTDQKLSLLPKCCRLLRARFLLCPTAFVPNRQPPPSPRHSAHTGRQLSDPHRPREAAQFEAIWEGAEISPAAPPTGGPMPRPGPLCPSHRSSLPPRWPTIGGVHGGRGALPWPVPGPAWVCGPRRGPTPHDVLVEPCFGK